MMVKEEIEFKWIVSLMNSPYLKGGILRKQIGGCKKDFERIACVAENHKIFRQWLDGLIKEGILEFFEYKDEKTRPVKTYVINGGLLEKKLSKNKLYEPVMKYMHTRKFIGIRTDRIL